MNVVDKVSPGWNNDCLRNAHTRSAVRPVRQLACLTPSALQLKG
jgi:hypothetical protein